MTFKELKDSFLSRVSGARGNKQDEPEVVSNMANGGTSGYRPGKVQGRSIFSTQSLPVQQATQPQPRQSTGMTGRFNAMDGQMQQTGLQQPQQDFSGTYQQTGFQQNPYQPTMNQQPYYGQQDPAGYQQTGFQQDPYQQGGFQQTGYQQNPPQQPYQQGGFQQTGYQQPYPPQQPQQPDNISYMPGSNFVDEDRRGYTHVERIVQLVSVAACFRIIEFMRNGESVIVNTESIANEADIQRCLDMLAGAAFTLECSLTKITQVKRAYLIAPKTVLVMQDKSFAHWNERDNMQMPEMDDAQESYRAERGAYVPDRRWERQPEPYQTTGYRPQARPPQASFTNRQSPLRTERAEARGSYQSDTRRGVYATMRRPQGEKGYMQ